MHLHSRKKSGHPAATIDVLPNDLVVDILARLPGKQIGICKCVCKPWRSTIRSRPFRYAYRKYNSGLLIYYRSREDKRQLRFFHCPLRRRDELPGDFSPLSQFALLKKSEGRVSGLAATEMVDGLLCSYTHISPVDRSSVYGLTLHNICTGENMKIPDPLTCPDTESVYNIGYDGAGRVYKLLRLIFNRLDRTLLGAHIMTLRPSSGPPSPWRELANCGLPSDLNGLRGVKTCSDDGLMCWYSRDESMFWFDLNKERFRVVELPQDVKCGKMNVFRGVTRLNDSLALWVSSSYSTVNVSCYVQEDEEGKNWRISKAIQLSRGFTFAAGIFPSSSKGEMFGVGFGGILSYSRRQTDNDVSYAGKLPAGNPALARSSKLHCLADANNLYMPLDDVLGGGSK